MTKGNSDWRIPRTENAFPTSLDSMNLVMLDLEINILDKSIIVKIEEIYLEMVVMVFQSIQSTYAK